MATISDEEFKQLMGSKPQVNLSDLESKYKLPSNILGAVLYAEGSRSDQTSPKGAEGRFQLMPQNSKAYNANPRDYDQSANAAASLLSDAMKAYQKKYPNATPDQMRDALVAHYNGGWKNGNSVMQTGSAVSDETKKYLKKTNQFFSTQQQPQQSSGNTISDEEFSALLKTSGTNQPSKSIINSAIESGLVGTDTALNALSAGLYHKYANKNQRFATDEQIANSPVASLAGNIAGTVPYMFVPGGLPAQMAVLGGRGAAQAYNENKNVGDIAAAGAIEGAAPGIGKLASKGLELAGKGARYAIEKTFGKAPPHSEIINMVNDVGDVGARSVAEKTSSQSSLTAEPLNKSEFGKKLLENIKSSSGVATIGGVIGAQMTPENPIAGALTGASLGAGGAGIIKYAIGKTITENFPRIAPNITEKALKFLPSLETNGDKTKFINFWIDNRLASSEKTVEQLMKQKDLLIKTGDSKAANKIQLEINKAKIAPENAIAKFTKEADDIFNAAQETTKRFNKNIGRAATGSVLAGKKTIDMNQTKQKSSNTISDEEFANILKGQ